MSSPTHSYYDWQVSTLLLAYDAVDPVPRDDVESFARRQQNVEEELHQMVQAILPKDYLENPQQDFPPEIIIQLTRSTLSRAARIIGLLRTEA